MSNLLDGKPKPATEEQCKAAWGGGKNGKWFRCFLCGHKFKVGDIWRFVPGGKWCNFLVCEKCDGPNEELRDRWGKMNKEARDGKYWWFCRHEEYD